jgi:hypothetical protein
MASMTASADTRFNIFGLVPSFGLTRTPLLHRPFQLLVFMRFGLASMRKRMLIGHDLPPLFLAQMLFPTLHFRLRDTL